MKISFMNTVLILWLAVIHSYSSQVSYAESDNIKTTIRDQKQRRSISKRSSGYIIETFVWSAPDVFKFHRSRLGLSGPETELTFLRIWERAIIRDVDLIFRNIEPVSARAFYMGGGNDRKLDVPWYQDNVQDDVIRRQALANVTSYLVDLVANDKVPAYDHVVVLTRQDLVDSFALSGQDKISFGVADSICNTPPGGSVSMAEISSPFFIKAVAQSILFAFGLTYTDDVQDIEDSFTVMSREVNTNVLFANRADRWRVDQGSSEELQTKIESLNPNCLLEEIQDYDGVDEPFGEVFPTLTEQCQIIAGSDSDICQVGSATQCYSGLKCYDSRQRCVVDYFSGDRTPCGTDLGCRFGECTFSTAPTTTDRATL